MGRIEKIGSFVTIAVLVDLEDAGVVLKMGRMEIGRVPTISGFEVVVPRVTIVVVTVCWIGVPTELEKKALEFVRKVVETVFTLLFALPELVASTGVGVNNTVVVCVLCPALVVVEFARPPVVALPKNCFTISKKL